MAKRCCSVECVHIFRTRPGDSFPSAHCRPERRSFARRLVYAKQAQCERRMRRPASCSAAANPRAQPPQGIQLVGGASNSLALRPAPNRPLPSPAVTSPKHQRSRTSATPTFEKLRRSERHSKLRRLKSDSRAKYFDHMDDTGAIPGAIWRLALGPKDGDGHLSPPPLPLFPGPARRCESQALLKWKRLDNCHKWHLLNLPRANRGATQTHRHTITPRSDRL